MPITANKLTAALKRKYGTPAAVFRRLGLDENANALPPPMRGSSDDPLREMRLEFERLLAELHLGDEHHAKVLELLDRHAPLEAGDADPPLVSSSPIQNERSNGHDEDDDEKRLGQFAEFLRRKGFSSSDIATAIDIARNGGGTAKDRLPVSRPRRRFAWTYVRQKPRRRSQRIARACGGDRRRAWPRSLSPSRDGQGAEQGGARPPQGKVPWHREDRYRHRRRRRSCGRSPIKRREKISRHGADRHRLRRDRPRRRSHGGSHST